MTDYQQTKGQYLEAYASMTKAHIRLNRALLKYTSYPRWKRAVFFWRFIPYHKRVTARFMTFRTHLKIMWHLDDALRKMETKS